jgi:transcriptional regulator GlxA family with amidase domain
VNWIREIGQAAEWITSHCDGAFMLAKASLLDNVASTTFPIDIEAYKTMFPHLDVRSDVVVMCNTYLL